MVGVAHAWRVLVAEDDGLFADAVHTFLQGAGFEVVIARDGEAALQQATDGAFDALLTDLRMPRLGGAALIRKLRAGPRTGKTACNARARDRWSC